MTACVAMPDPNTKRFQRTLKDANNLTSTEQAVKTKPKQVFVLLYRYKIEEYNAKMSVLMFKFLLQIFFFFFFFLQANALIHLYFSCMFIHSMFMTYELLMFKFLFQVGALQIFFCRLMLSSTSFSCMFIHSMFMTYEILTVALMKC